MGNYSYLVGLRNNSEDCIIDWDNMNLNNLKSYYIQNEYTKPVEERAKTLADMAKVLNDTKLCGYLDADYIMTLEEFCKHLIPYNCHPRLYYKFEGWHEIWCFEFIPGTGIVNYGVYDYGTLFENGNKPKSPEGIDDESDEYYDVLDAYELQIQKSVIDMDGWEMKRLQHIKMSDAEAFALLVKRVMR